MANPRKRNRLGADTTIQVSVQTAKGLCAKGKKCVRKTGHAGECWPRG